MTEGQFGWTVFVPGMESGARLSFQIWKSAIKEAGTLSSRSKSWSQQNAQLNLSLNWCWSFYPWITSCFRFLHCRERKTNMYISPPLSTLKSHREILTKTYESQRVFIKTVARHPIWTHWPVFSVKVEARSAVSRRSYCINKKQPGFCWPLFWLDL